MAYSLIPPGPARQVSLSRSRRPDTMRTTYQQIPSIQYTTPQGQPFLREDNMDDIEMDVDYQLDVAPERTWLSGQSLNLPYHEPIGPQYTMQYEVQMPGLENQFQSDYSVHLSNGSCAMSPTEGSYASLNANSYDLSHQSMSSTYNGGSFVIGTPSGTETDSHPLDENVLQTMSMYPLETPHQHPADTFSDLYINDQMPSFPARRPYDGRDAILPESTQMQLQVSAPGFQRKGPTTVMRMSSPSPFYPKEIMPTSHYNDQFVGPACPGSSIQESPSPSEDHSIHYHDSYCKSIGGRPVGSKMSVAGKSNARKVHAAGGQCWRCRFLRQKCSPGMPCESCIKKDCGKGAKIHNYPCARDKIQERLDFMFPEFLHLDFSHQRVESFVRQHSSIPCSGPFKLVLTMNFGADLEFQAYRFHPSTLKILFNCGMVQEGLSQKSVSHFYPSPPIALHNQSSQDIEHKIHTWLDNIINEELEYWADFCFQGEAPEMVWQCSMVNAIYEFYQESKTQNTVAKTTLRAAFLLSILNFMIAHSLIVPDEAKDDLAENLKGFDKGYFDKEALRERIISPRIVNRRIKSIIAPLLRKYTHDVLFGLNKLITMRGDEDYGHVFSAIFILLTVIGDIQAFMADKIELAKEREGNFGYFTQQDEEIIIGHDSARESMKEMDHQLTTFLIYLFKGKYKVIHAKSFNPLYDTRVWSKLDDPTLRLVHQVRDIMLGEQSPFGQFRHRGVAGGPLGQQSPPIEELDDIDTKLLRAKNTHRVLLMFMTPLFFPPC